MRELRVSRDGEMDREQGEYPSPPPLKSLEQTTDIWRTDFDAPYVTFDDTSIVANVFDNHDVNA